MKNITAIIQARLGSTRLPGKTLLKIKGKSLLGHLVTRVKASKHVTDIIIATTTNRNDDAIVEFARENNLKSYRGSEEDVLDRFYQTATLYGAETIVRVTPDCPLMDPKVMDLVVSTFIDGKKYDYVSNVLVRTYPKGLDTEIFSFSTLERAWKEAKLPSEREHVTAYIIKHPEIFRLLNVYKNGEDLSWMRWTIDTQKDFEFVSKVFDSLYSLGDLFYMEDVISLLQKKPSLLDINKGIIRNEGYQESLSKDKILEARSHERNI